MDIREIVKNPWVTHSAALAIGVGIGYGGIRLWLRRETKEATEFAEEMEQLAFDFSEVADNVIRMIPPSVTPELVQEFEKAETDKRQRSIDSHPSSYGVELDPELDDPVPEEEQSVVTNVFRAEDNGWDYEFELEQRKRADIYVIHKDEFFGDEMEWDSQSTLTYYVGDDVLTDENDVPIYNISATIGEIKFGHGSGDPNVFYVRNEKTKAEYEILRHAGTYETEVLGNSIEEGYARGDLKHMHAPGKFPRD